jgi:glycine betaine/proline transport system permease protein
VELHIGTTVERGVDFLSDKGEPVFNIISMVIKGLVDIFENILVFPHPLVMLAILSVFSYVMLARTEGLFTKKGTKKGAAMFLFTFTGFLLIYFMGYWHDAMAALALVIASTIISIVTGVPLGIWAARNDRVEAIIKPILDFMQTMPAFVYLIPVIFFFGLGKVPGVVATVVFSLPPAVRLTNLGIRGVQEDVIEASHAFGCTDTQLLLKVQIPLAMPTILAGINQVIMLALSMVVIAAMVGAPGLGQKVYGGITQANVALGFEAGLGIVIIAIFLDRVTQSFGKSSK